MAKLAPAMFISHGSPMMALEKKGTATDQWRILAKHMADAKAIVIMSPHWPTRGGVGVTGAAEPGIIHDFGGFPAELYRVTHAAKGDKALTQQVVNCLQAAGVHVAASEQQPFDHGAWVPLLHLDADARRPVVQLSVDLSASYHDLFMQGQAMATLREQGIAIVGSGALTHNLRDVFMGGMRSLKYVSRFTHWVRERVENRTYDELLETQTLAPDFSQAHPYDEHFRPLMFALGASLESDQLKVLDGGVYDRCLAMENYLWSA
ncbi:MAG: DODA-type extradiol aromatic ring-opening family dioxygenase [Pontibacterium sp.]